MLCVCVLAEGDDKKGMCCYFGFYFDYTRGAKCDHEDGPGAINLAPGQGGEGIDTRSASSAEGPYAPPTITRKHAEPV
jgi:hypothetical protein